MSEVKVTHLSGGSWIETRDLGGGRTHRIEYCKDGSISSKSWYLNGGYHREDGPAIIGYREDGSIDYESWYLNNRKHREDGPAYIEYREDGSIKHQIYKLLGKELRVRTLKGLQKKLHEMICEQVHDA